MKRLPGFLLAVGALGFSHAASELQLDTLPRMVQPGDRMEIRWARTGHVPFVKIEYRYTVPSYENWIRIADSVPDTGKYVWTVPYSSEGIGLTKRASTVFTARLRISGPDSVLKDSANFNIVFSTRLGRASAHTGGAAFSVSGFGAVLSNLPENARVDVHDPRGKLVTSRILAKNAAWDRRDARGIEVSFGSYLLRAVAGGKTVGTARLLIP